jgi:3-hydroxyisobutyrate dehydrogenase-like beta-hydroxyacid dehydrogenase
MGSVPRLAFVGLGAMGSRLARRLLAAGHPVTGWNRTPDKARALVAAGLTLAKSPRAAAEGAEAVFTMVTDDAALRAVAHGSDGIIAGLGPDSVLVEMSTVSPAVVRELEAPVTARGAALLDVPVSGSTITVEQGQASFIVGGDAAALERVRPWLLAMGAALTHVGPLGLAKTMKVATNLGLAVQMLAFSEAVLLAETAGIPRERAVEALLKSVIASPMVKYRGPFVLGQMPADVGGPGVDDGGARPRARRLRFRDRLRRARAPGRRRPERQAGGRPRAARAALTGRGRRSASALAGL